MGHLLVDLVVDDRRPAGADRYPVAVAAVLPGNGFAPGRGRTVAPGHTGRHEPVAPVPALQARPGRGGRRPVGGHPAHVPVGGQVPGQFRPDGACGRAVHPGRGTKEENKVGLALVELAREQSVRLGRGGTRVGETA